LKGIVKFGNITVKQIMKTRVDVHGVDQDNFWVSWSLLYANELQPLPVYKEDLDNVVG
jgi:putative hemolysin